MDIKAGEILALTSGDYSDYSLNAFARAAVDFSLIAKRKEFMEEVSSDDKTYYFELPRKFVAWLVTKGLIEETDNAREVYIDNFRLMEKK